MTASSPGSKKKRQQLDAQNLEVDKLKRDAEWAKQETEEIKANWVAKIETKVQEAVTDREARLQSALATCKDLAERISRLRANREPRCREDSGGVAGRIEGDAGAKRKTWFPSSRENQAKSRVAQLRILESETGNAAFRHGRAAPEEPGLGASRWANCPSALQKCRTFGDQKAAWESRESALRTCIEGLRSELGELVDKSKAQRVFPSLTADGRQP